MSYKEIKNMLEKISNENHKEYVKALISIEKSIENETILDSIYQKYMENDTIQLLNDEL